MTTGIILGIIAAGLVLAILLALLILSRLDKDYKRRLTEYSRSQCEPWDQQIVEVPKK